MPQVILARWQFGITTVYHFLFVPLTIGLAFLLAVIESYYVATGNEEYRRAAQFWGRLFLINFALGVVTGILQEFQFGMNWASYSRFVGDIFGAPLAIEGLLSFFLESTFLGIWMFGWDRLPRGLHLFAIWMVAVGTTTSALWILTANSFMQEPVGFKLVHGRAEMNNFWALLGNPQLWVEFPHTVLGAFSTGAFFMIGVSAWWLLRRGRQPEFLHSIRIGLTVAALASILTVVVGHDQAQHLVTAQPMKLAAAEALWDSSPQHAPWAVVGWVTPATHTTEFALRIPDLLTILAYNRLSGSVTGMNVIQARYVHRYGPGNYMPPVRPVFYSFRVMILAGTLMVLLSWLGVYWVIKNRLLLHRRYLKVMVWAIGLPYLANIAGWLMTEIGRQPWIVFGLLLTDKGVSPTVGAGEIWTTLVGFTAVYAILAAADVYLLVKFIKAGLASEQLTGEARTA
ncbi:MAG: cytochrome ubiquinol oxidase subunit I [Firmicutes bacterium]|nr:cytochrome ubiquinol oxidase subunit I [Bacillota bacterium]